MQDWAGDPVTFCAVETGCKKAGCFGIMPIWRENRRRRLSMEL